MIAMTQTRIKMPPGANLCPAVDGRATDSEKIILNP